MTKNFTTALTAALLIFSALPAATCAAAPSRIVSMTPVGTEILFDLGQGDNVIAVTNFCDYPPEALKKPKIGGYAEINFEALLTMRTDLLVLQDMQERFGPQLKKLKIPYAVVKQGTVSEICDSIELLGGLCGVPEQAAQRTAEIKRQLAEIAARTERRQRQRVMVCVSRELSEPHIRSFYIAAADNFYNELIGLAGGVNAAGAANTAYPHISVEGLLRLNPDVIIDLVGDRNFYHAKERIDKDAIFDGGTLARQWRGTAAVNAVRNDSIAILEGTVYLRPGPRVARVVRAFSEAIHPEVWR